MKPSVRLIEGLRDAADGIENHPNLFDHSKYGYCLLGYLAYCTSDMGHCSIRDSMLDFMESDLSSECGDYTTAAQDLLTTCPTTGLSMNQVIAHLYELGLTEPADYEDIEYLGKGRNPNAEITAEEAVAYLRDKANQLERQMFSLPVSNSGRATVA